MINVFSKNKIHHFKKLYHIGHNNYNIIAVKKDYNFVFFTNYNRLDLQTSI